MKRFTLMVVIMFAMLFGAMVERAFAQDRDRGVDDAVFLLESSAHTVDFEQRADSEIQIFVMTACTLFRGVIPNANSSINERDCERLFNLVKHINYAVNELKLRKQLTNKEYQQMMEAIRMMYEQGTKAYERGLRR